MLRLSTGRLVESLGGALSPDPETGELYWGSDGLVEPSDGPLTAAEATEIADWMIERWQRWRAHWV